MASRFKGQYGRAWGAGQERLHRGVFQLFHFVTGVLCWNVTQWPGSTPTAPLEAKKPMESKVCQPILRSQRLAWVLYST